MQGKTHGVFMIIDGPVFFGGHMGSRILGNNTECADEDIIKDKGAILLRSDGPVFRTEDGACPEPYLCVWHCNAVCVQHNAAYSTPTQEWNKRGNFLVSYIQGDLHATAVSVRIRALQHIVPQRHNRKLKLTVCIGEDRVNNVDKVIRPEKLYPHTFTGRGLTILQDGGPHNRACFNQDDFHIPEKTVWNVHGAEMVSLQTGIEIGYLNPYVSKIDAHNTLHQEVPFAVRNIIQAVDIHVRAGHGGHGGIIDGSGYHAALYGHGHTAPEKSLDGGVDHCVAA